MNAFDEALQKTEGFPSFLQDVFIVSKGFGHPPNQISPMYCATPESAAHLFELITKARPDWKVISVVGPPTPIVQGWPYRYEGGLDRMGGVPIFIFTLPPEKGKKVGKLVGINPGKLCAIYINQGLYPDLALSTVLRDIENTLAEGPPAWGWF